MRIWDEWADERGDLGPVYGQQWRSWPAQDGKTIDQIGNVIAMIKRNPDSRRLIVTAWNPADVDKMALASVPLPCFSFMSRTASCRASSISARPMFFSACRSISHPTRCSRMMVAQVTGYKPGDFIHTFGDAHLYLNHLEQARLQLSRAPRRCRRCGSIPAVKDIFAFRYEDFYDRELRSAPAHQGRGGGVTWVPKSDCSCCAVCRHRAKLILTRELRSPVDFSEEIRTLAATLVIIVRTSFVLFVIARRRSPMLLQFCVRPVGVMKIVLVAAIGDNLGYWPGRPVAMASEVGPPALPQSDAQSPGDHGPQDARVDRQVARRPHQYRAHA